MGGDDDSLASQSIETVSKGAEDISTALTSPQENRLKRWLLLDGDRRSVAAALLFGVFLSLIFLEIVWPLRMRELLTETTTVQTLFNTLLSGTILLVSIVVSINSVVLSQDLTSLGTQQNRLENSLEFRRGAEDVIDRDVSPADPARFLQAILDAIREQGDALRASAADGPDATFRDRVAAYVDILARQATQANSRLADAERGTKNVLLAGLAYDYSWQIYAARRLRIEHADVLSEEVDAAFDELIETLETFGTGREYFKTLYYMQEFATLSRTLLFVSLPTIVFISYVLLGVDAQLFPEIYLLNLTPLMMFVSAAYTIALAPYVVLTAYVIRPATVAKRTLAAGPFVFRSNTDEQEALDWGE